MRRKPFLVLLLIFVVSSFLVSGCGLLGLQQQDPESAVQTSVAQTSQAQALIQTSVAQTRAAGGDGEGGPTPTSPPEAEATLTATPTIAPTSTISPTPTLSAPQVHVDVNTNCRVGPGVSYERLGALLVGEEVEVVGRWPGGDYWIVQNPDASGECWLWGNYATVEGPTDALPAYTQPATPTPSFTPTPAVDWSGTWETTQIGGAAIVHIVTVAQSGNSATGTYTSAGGTTVNMTGSLSDDYRTWSGTYTAPTGGTGTFVWQMVGMNQFRGNADGPVSWCGYRQGSGAGNPTPCGGP